MEDLDYRILTGFVMIFVGFCILLISRVTSFDGFFYVFPFFFMWDGADFSPLLVVFVVSLMMFFFFWRFSKIRRELHHTTSSTQKGSIYLKTDKNCNFCGNAIPSNASFCQVCGSPIKRDEA